MNEQTPSGTPFLRMTPQLLNNGVLHTTEILSTVATFEDLADHTAWQLYVNVWNLVLRLIQIYPEIMNRSQNGTHIRDIFVVYWWNNPAHNWLLLVAAKVSSVDISQNRPPTHDYTSKARSLESSRGFQYCLGGDCSANHVLYLQPERAGSTTPLV